tara:strand:+ start:251 stop:511 length:261 start_codon:yes stop_codon:yes gene_type:complete
MELIVPTLGESITEATVSKWLKKVGDSFDADEPLVEIETDKITVEVPAPSAGSITEIKVEEGVRCKYWRCPSSTWRSKNFKLIFYF